MLYPVRLNDLSKNMEMSTYTCLSLVTYFIKKIWSLGAYFNKLFNCDYAVNIVWGLIKCGGLEVSISLHTANCSWLNNYHQQQNISTKFSNNFEALAPELLENLVERFPHWY